MKTKTELMFISHLAATVVLAVVMPGLCPTQANDQPSNQILTQITNKLQEPETPATATTPKTESSKHSRIDAPQRPASGDKLRVNADKSFVRTHGQLSVEGTKLVDAHGKSIVLRGVSYGWHNWWHQYYNADSVGWLAEDWKCTVIRAAMGVGPKGSYLDRPEWSQKLVSAVVDAAIANDIYVIIDWHDHNAHEHTDEAVAFFTKMAKRYGGKPNVIYEIYNEPASASWPEVKRYSKKVIDAIRAIDPDNIILVGSPHWDQDVHIAADDPLVGEKNVMYTLHFYADTHKQDLRDRGDYALSKGLPLFVSEYGGCAANGDGPLNMEEWNAWIQWMEKHQISWVTWSISSKDETCSMLPAKAADTGNWPVETLKPSGAHTRELLRRLNDPPKPASNNSSGGDRGKKAKETDQQTAFAWSSDCSSENTFVNSTHSIIPGHYEYVPDPTGKASDLPMDHQTRPNYDSASFSLARCASEGIRVYSGSLASASGWCFPLTKSLMKFQTWRCPTKYFSQTSIVPNRSGLRFCLRG